MWHLMGVYWKQAIRKTSLKIVWLLLVSSLACLYFYTRYVNISTYQEDVKIEQIGIKTGLSYYQDQPNNSAETYQLVQNLNEQNNAISKIQMAVTMENQRAYIEGFHTLYTKRQAIYNLAGFEQIKELVPSQHQNQRQLELLTALLANQAPIENSKQNFRFYFENSLILIGLIWFLLMTLLTCDIGEISRNVSLWRVLPYRPSRKLGSLGFNQGLIVVFSVGVGLVTPLAIGSIGFKLRLDEVFVVVLHGNYRVISLGHYMWLVGIGLCFVGLFSMGMSYFLYQLLQDKYLVCFAQALGYSLLYLLPSMLQHTVYLPLIYLNPVALLQGDVAEWLGRSTLDYQVGYFVLGLSGMMLIVLGILISHWKERVGQ